MTDLKQKLSENFYLYEFVKSQEAARHDIDNTPSKEVIGNLVLLCENVLQPIRDVWGTVTINSGFRCLDLNRRLKSKDTSDHVTGCAADIECAAISNYKLAQWIQSEIEEFNQLILECYKPGIPDSGWVHVSFRYARNKNEVLTFDGKQYHFGLIK